MLKKYVCKINMSSLRRLYPYTNYSTEAVFNFENYADNCIEEFKKELLSKGWEQKQNFFHLGRCTLDIHKDYVYNGKCKYSITPFIG